MRREAELEAELYQLNGRSAGNVEELETMVSQLRQSLSDTAAADKGLRVEVEALREDKLRLTAKVNSLQEVKRSVLFGKDRKWVLVCSCFIFINLHPMALCRWS